MLDQIPQVYRGHLDDCWQEFCRQFNQKMPPHSKGLSSARDPMVRFCRVQGSSVQRWMSGETLPMGGTKVRLICYLALHGYKVIEFERLQMSLRAMTELIGFSVVTNEDMCQYLGYSSTSTLYDVLYEKQNPSEDVLEKMRSLHKEKKAELEAKKKYSYENFRLKCMLESPVQREALDQPKLALVSPGENMPAVPPAISFIHGLLGVFNQGTFARFSDEDIRSFNLDALAILELGTHLSQFGTRVVKLKG